MIGRTISHYRVDAKLGEGGMGVVYRARDLSLNRNVAIKFLSSDVADEERRRPFPYRLRFHSLPFASIQA